VRREIFQPKIDAFKDIDHDGLKAKNHYKVVLPKALKLNRMISYRELRRNGNLYHECPYCFCLFVNENFLKNHISRKHE
jgi:hypothetical protein